MKRALIIVQTLESFGKPSEKSAHQKFGLDRPESHRVISTRHRVVRQTALCRASWDRGAAHAAKPFACLLSAAPPRTHPPTDIDPVSVKRVVRSALSDRRTRSPVRRPAFSPAGNGGRIARTQSARPPPHRAPPPHRVPFHPPPSPSPDSP